MLFDIYVYKIWNIFFSAHFSYNLAVNRKGVCVHSLSKQEKRPQYYANFRCDIPVLVCFAILFHRKFWSRLESHDCFKTCRIVFIFWSTGEWVYPVLRVLSFFWRLCFFVAIWLFLFLAYFIGLFITTSTQTGKNSDRPLIIFPYLFLTFSFSAFEITKKEE